MKSRILKGQCLCRAVTYEVADDFEYAMNCHCSECQSATGAAINPMAGIKIEKIAIVAGQSRQQLILPDVLTTNAE